MSIFCKGHFAFARKKTSQQIAEKSKSFVQFKGAIKHPHVAKPDCIMCLQP